MKDKMIDNTTAYGLIRYEDDNCLKQIADSLRPKYNLAFNEGELFWDFDMDTGDMILYIYDGDNRKLDEITYNREALIKALEPCVHINTANTLDGEICLDCGLETGGEEE